LPPLVEGPSATIALVLAETAAGATMLLWLGRLWGEVRRGFFVLVSAVALGCVLLAILSWMAILPGSDGQELALLGAIPAAVLLGAGVSALVLKADTVARVLGVLSLPAVLLLVAGFAFAGDEVIPSLLQLFAGALFLGAVTDGLLLGHWYLTDRRLSRDHIKRFTALLLAAVVVETISLVVFGLSESSEAGQFSVILGVSGLTTWIALGMVACTGLIAFLIRASLRGSSPRAVQGATGFFYLAVITAFTAEMAAKVGFLS
jgi:hypothetical protein